MTIQKVKNIIFLTMITFALTLTPAAASDNPAGQTKHAEQGASGVHEGFYKDLNLSDGQRKLLEENRAKNREQMKALVNEIKEKKSAMRRELQKEALDMTKINQTNQDLKKLEAQMLDYRLERIFEVRKILTPEQFRKFMDNIEKRGYRFKNGHPQGPR